MTNSRLHQRKPRSCEECNRKKAKCDKKTPECIRCQAAGTDCVYPTKRKRVSLETKYQSLRRKLLDANQSDKIDDLLDHIDPDALREALSRRDNKSESSISPPGDSTSNVPGDSQPTSTMAMSETPNPISLVWKDSNSTSDPLGTDEVLAIPQDRTWMDSADFGSFVDTYGMFGLFDSTEFQGDVCSGSAQSVSQDLKFADQTSYTLEFPPSLLDELVDLYFLRVQPFLPLLHEPRFRHKFQVGTLGNDRYSHLSLADALAITAMAALSARFSSNMCFASMLPQEKGKLFARRAIALYAEALQSDDLNECSLAFLQGCILLAFYEQTHKITTQSWLLIGTCCRLAIDLGLNAVDRCRETLGEATAEVDQYSEDTWTYMEEKRRAWWAVWELDVFAATILRRPYSICKDQMDVLLPVSDALWFSDTPAESTFLQTDMPHSWQTLETFPNADARAWFLVTTYLMVRASELAAPHNTSTLDSIINFESTLNCFALLLPPSFHLDLVATPFDESNFAANNWVILTIFMLHTVRILIRHAQNAKVQHHAANFVESSATPLTGPFVDTQLVFRAMQNWPPQYMIYACPFVACTIIGPAFDNIRAALLFEPGNHGNYLAMLKLILKRIGSFWGLAESAWNLVEVFEHEIKVNGPFRKQAMQRHAKDFPLLIADLAQNNLLFTNINDISGIFKAVLESREEILSPDRMCRGIVLKRTFGPMNSTQPPIQLF